MADETTYLRTASINTFNGMVGLTFSYDGSHYMHYDKPLQDRYNILARQRCMNMLSVGVGVKNNPSVF